MDKLLENIYDVVVFIVLFFSVLIELPIKIFLTLLFLVLFTILAFFAPIFNNFVAPKWLNNWHDYIKNPLIFKSVNWILNNY